ncbi:MAG: HAD family hydrolase [Candidatus Odinarchaeum yellowstonii]|uniref:HAD family hydrolase n=1 Tax=Odinarchaeota yellowstonii (strain LCB_4) TaxID=1841599 RepID=A0AAF0IAY7_ODILC|nr:MAG: HAD family hydrolase [Candidatus Odinarchaeum yellowstonii]
MKTKAFKQIKAVVFDLDGTLVDFKIDYVNARNRVKNYLISVGVPVEYLEDQPIFISLEKAVNYLQSVNRGENEIKNLKESVNRIVFEYEFKAGEETYLKPKARETLNAIKKFNLKIGLFTINNRVVTERVLDKTGIREFFDAIITRDDTCEIKPREGHFLKVLNDLNVKPDESVVIGDTAYDFQAAKKLGALTIGVEGLYDANYFKKVCCVDYTVKELSEIVEIIKSYIER